MSSSPFHRKIQNLQMRARLIRKMREFFEERDFLAIETPLLVRNPGLEPHLEHFKTQLKIGMGINKSETLFLPTSPEYHLKKALGWGIPKVFEITKSFRNAELSPKHQPEFSILEWYRCPGTYCDIANDFSELCAILAKTFELNPLWANSKYISVRDAFKKFANLDLDEILLNPDSLSLAARKAGHEFVEADDDFSSSFNKIIVTLIEKNLGFQGIEFLWDYPASEAALSQKKSSNSLYCERFEIYWKGIELANAFGELTDSAEQRKRCEVDRNVRMQLYGESPPLDEEFLESLSEIKNPAGGIAVGLDRLIMCLLESNGLKEVIAFPYEN